MAQSTDLQLVNEKSQQLGSILSMVERVATNPDADMGKLEKLLDMQERILDREAEISFSRAMCAAQSEMTPISADAVNPHTKSEYAKYAKIDKALRPIYTRHGFALNYDTAHVEKQDTLRLVCHVSHTDGHHKSYSIDMPADGTGAKGGAVMTKTHATGSAATYGRRYLLKMIFNVAIGEDDNDGNGDIPLVNEKQVADILALISEVNADIKRFCDYFKVGRIEELSSDKYDRAIQMLETKRKEQHANS